MTRAAIIVGRVADFVARAARLPATCIEAMYAPEMFGAEPNAKAVVKPR